MAAAADIHRPTPKQSPLLNLAWMVFTTVWVAVLVTEAIRYAASYTATFQVVMPPQQVVPKIPVWYHLAAIALALAFVLIYVRAILRLYSWRKSWYTAFSERERNWLRWSLLVLAVALQTLPFVASTDFCYAFVFVAIAWAFTSKPDTVILSVLLVLAIAILAMGASEQDGRIFGVSMFITAFGGMIAAFVRNNDLIGQLIVEQGRVADQSATEERFRIARDLHDTVGHSLTQITLKTELARRILPTTPDRAAAELKGIEDLSRDLSREIRAAVSGAEPQTLSEELARAQALLESASVELTVIGDSRQVPTTIARVLAWCLKEGVMNTLKHSGAAKVSIKFTTDDAAIRLEIEDNGSRAPYHDPSGQGLIGMRQRLQRFGGIVTFAPTGNGHILTVQVPR